MTDPFLRVHAQLGRPVVRRVLAGVVALVLFGWMVVLAASGSAHDVRAVGEEEVAYRVTCDSVIEAVLGTDDGFVLDEENTFAVPEDYGEDQYTPPDALGRRSVTRQCQDVRTAHTGFLALLAVPTSVAAAGALLGGRRG